MLGCSLTWVYAIRFVEPRPEDSFVWPLTAVALAGLCGVLVHVGLFRFANRAFRGRSRGFGAMWILTAIGVGAALARLVPLSDRIPGEGVRFELVAGGRRNPESKGSRVRVKGLFGADGKGVRALEFQTEGDWAYHRFGLVSQDEQPAALRWEGMMRTGELRLESGPDAGIARISWNGRPQTVDLYAPKIGLRRVSLGSDIPPGRRGSLAASVAHYAGMIALTLAAMGLVGLLPVPRGRRHGEADVRGLIVLLAATLPVVVFSHDFARFVRGNALYDPTLADALAVAAAMTYSLLVLAMANRSRALAKATVVVYSSAICLVLAEFTLRAVHPVPPHNVPLQPGMRRVSTAADTMPGISGRIEYTVNDMGLRGPQADPGKADFRILCIGGSTTECLYVTDRKSWPWRLGDILSERLGKDVFVGNAGRSGHFTLHHIHQLEHYPPAPSFDWIVLMCGINDLGLTMWANIEDRRPRVAEEALMRNPEARDTYLEHRSWLFCLARSAARFVSQRRRQNVLIQDEAGYSYRRIRQRRGKLVKAGVITTRPAVYETAMAAYKENVRRIIRICKSRGQRILILTQPTLWRADLPPRLRGLVASVGKEGAYELGLLSEMMSEYNDASRQVCREEGADCVDLDAKLTKDTSVFYDDCHFNISGCRKVASILADFFAERYGAAASHQGGAAPADGSH